ncbi:MAG: carboxypeptidase regulatory-like domain-containing protein, partial [Acidobacteria bacterium]|nr:carboxypeptidase regulatory-like domain-containing protein [Acidobacteriota bacterium]
MRKLFPGCVLLLMMASAAAAQIVTGSILGTVQDPSGLPVAGAKVILIHPATARERETVTDERGDFVFHGLDAGSYNLAITATGFKKTERTGVPLTTGERLALGTLPLELGQVTETVSVTAQAATIETRSAERAAVITNRQVENLLVRGRNVIDLVQLLPGVVVGSSQEDLSSGSEFYVQGNRRAANNIPSRARVRFTGSGRISSGTSSSTPTTSLTTATGSRSRATATTPGPTTWAVPSTSPASSTAIATSCSSSGARSSGRPGPTAFAGNVIPAGRIDTSGQALLKVFALPNFDRALSRGQYNYVFTAPTDLPKSTSSLKIDYNLNSTNTLVGSFSAFNEDHTGSVGLPSSGGLNWPQTVKTWGTHPKSLTTRYT